MPTHEVFNQPPVFQDINLFDTDRALVDAVARSPAAEKIPQLSKFGALTGSAESIDAARLANEHSPVLKTHDTRGHRVDIVEFHPAYHQLMSTSASAGLHNGSFAHLVTGAQPVEGTNVARSAAFYLATQMEASHCCPITMTNAAIPSLLMDKEVGADWLEKILVNDYDPAFSPITEKRAATIGMGMTEKQGGTDVRANTTMAEPDGNGAFVLTGHKWFMSAPMCDAFLILAQAPGGLTCFLMPRFRPDGSRNRLFFQRLKNKLGNQANASSEVEFDNTYAVRLGDEGRGINTIIEMVTYTRLDCIVASAGLMHAAIQRALHHVRHRTVFQKKLIDQPLMRTVIADMILDHEAAVALSFRLAGSFDGRRSDAEDRAFARIMTPVIKYHICKTLPAIANEAMECLGGGGYVEDGDMARLYREAPLNAIWEGSGNVMCLDFLRAFSKAPDDCFGLIDSLTAQHKKNAAIRQAADWLKAQLADPHTLEASARAVTDVLARLAAACLLAEHAPPAIADSYRKHRLEALGSRLYGVLAADEASAVLSAHNPLH